MFLRTLDITLILNTIAFGTECSSHFVVYYYKTLKICEKCGKEIETEKCPDCEKKANVCEKCGTKKLSDDQKFCFNCGELLIIEKEDKIIECKGI